MKYKVGDKVRVRKDLKKGAWCGRIVTISQVGAGGYKIKGDGSRFWTDEMFEPVAKDLIQPGSVVECRSGGKFIYINGLFMHSDGWASLGNGGLRDFSDDLIFLNGDKDFDIMQIFESKAKTLNGIFEPISLTSVWERREPKEMTLEEVEKELGYPIKIVKGE